MPKIKRIWDTLLKPPFDPFVEQIIDEENHSFVLRSTAFDGIASPDGVHHAGKRIFNIINVSMSSIAGTDPVENGAVIELVQGGRPRRHIFMEVEAGTIRMRGRLAELTLRDADGNVIPLPPVPSVVQLWLRAAALEPKIGTALVYLKDKPGWFELYNAYESINSLANGGISKSEIKRFTQTANAGQRHPPGTYKPHEKPMMIWEARALMTRWISAAIEDTLAKSA